MKPKRILCGIDFSQHSLKTFKTAVEFAYTFGSELHVIHVIEANLAGQGDVMNLEEKAVRALNALVAEWANALDDGQVKIQVTTGLASDELVKYATEHEVDLTILGNKGITLFEEAVIGTTTQRVLKEAVCSVLVDRDG